MIKKKLLNVDDENKYKKVYRHNRITGHTWTTGNARLATGHDIRCCWCTSSFWQCYEIPEWPRLCQKCVGFLWELENPDELWKLRNDYPDEIPF